MKHLWNFYQAFCNCEQTLYIVTLNVANNEFVGLVYLAMLIPTMGKFYLNIF